MKLLVSRGANTSARDAEGSTVLLASLINGYAPLVKYLLTTGVARTAHTTHARQTHTTLTRHTHDTHDTHMTYDFDCPIGSGISEATEHNHEGDTAMLTTARTSSVECAELLLAHGASLDDKDNNDNNALMYAASGKSPEVHCTTAHTPPHNRTHHRTHHRTR
jgi:serine/threonine-protein phosphatase 6 regulatory ankyrin repeat subunit B